jgi:hypothetical protein
MFINYYINKKYSEILSSLLRFGIANSTLKNNKDINGSKIMKYIFTMEILITIKHIYIIHMRKMNSGKGISSELMIIFENLKIFMSK